MGNTNISSILQALRGDCDYITRVRLIINSIPKEELNRNEFRRIRIEEAKSFLIYLTLDSLKSGEQSDIILCSWGLLKGFDYALMLTERRLHYLREREEYISDYVYKKPFIELTEKQRKSRADGLRPKEDEICKIISDYFGSIPNKTDYLKKATKSYIIKKKLSPFADPVRYPTPSYLLHSSKKNRIRFINKAYNALFCGRSAELEKIESNFENSFNLQILYGLSGIGKTQIALQYAHIHKNDYDTIVLLNACNSKELLSGIISLLDSNDPEIDIDNLIERNTILNAFIKFLKRRENKLIIIDNVDYLDNSDDESAMMRDDITRLVSSNTAKILMTTRCDCDFEGAKRIRIDVFTPDVAVMYLEQKTGLKSDQYSELLAERIGYLPLALDYAGAYITAQKISYQKYINLWDKYGIKLFDIKNYADRTVRQAFHISLDIIMDGSDKAKAMLHLLSFCAQFRMEYLPLKLYIERYCTTTTNLIDHYRKELADKSNTYTYSLFYNADDKRDYPYILVDITDDHKLIYECTASSHKGETITKEIDNSTELFLDELERGEIIHRLSEYSLIAWDGEIVAVHPMLQEIIRDVNLSVNPSIFKDSDYLTWTEKSRIYNLYGDKKLSKKYEHSAIVNALDESEADVSLMKAVFQKQGFFCDFEADIVFLTDLLDRVLNFADDTLTKRLIEELFKVTDTLYSFDDKMHCKDTVLRYERAFFEKLSWNLGSVVFWVRSHTPAEIQSSDKTHCIECTDMNASFEKSPKLESAKAAIDEWIICDENSILREEADKSNWRVAAIII